MSDYHDTTRPIMKATAFNIGDGRVVISALIRGDGVDLVTQRPGYRATTVQLTVEQAREASRALAAAANESEEDR